MFLVRLGNCGIWSIALVDSVWLWVHCPPSRRVGGEEVVSCYELNVDIPFRNEMLKRHIVGTKSAFSLQMVQFECLKYKNPRVSSTFG